MSRPRLVADRRALPELRRRLGGERFPTVGLAAGALALLAWVVLAARVGMPVGMDPATPGALEAMATGGGPAVAARYLLMWGLMMVAMMYPSSAGAFQWYADFRARVDPEGVAGGVAAFVGAYTLLWLVLGLVPLAVDALVHIRALAAEWGALYLGSVLVAVGAFQLSPPKRRLLDRCRSPSASFAIDADDPPGPFRLGWRFGRHDLAACGPLMGLMVAVGSMNLRWMALITLLLSAERLTVRGLTWARLSGLVAVGAGTVLGVAWLA